MEKSKASLNIEMKYIKALLLVVLVVMLLGACTLPRPIDEARTVTPAADVLSGDSVTSTIEPSLDITPEIQTAIPTQTPLPTVVPEPTATSMPALPLGDFVSTSITSIAVGDDGVVWLGSDGGGISRFDGEVWATYTTQDGLLSDNVWSVAIAPDGTVWAGTWLGVSHFDGETWINYTTDDGLVSDSVTALAISDAGIWAASCRGVAEFSEESWIASVTGESPTRECINSVAVTPDGVLWASVYDRGVLRFDGETWSTSLPREELPHGVRALFASSDGHVWAATDGSGLYRLDGSTWEIVRSADGSGRVYSLVVTPDETAWIGVGGGFDVINGTEFREEAIVGDFFSPAYAAVATDGSLWAGINGDIGVHHFSDGAWSIHTPDVVSPSAILAQASYALEAKVATLKDVEKLEIIYGSSNGALGGNFGAEYVQASVVITDSEEIQRIMAGFESTHSTLPYWTRCGFYIQMNFYLQHGQTQALLVGTDSCLSFTSEFIQAVGKMSNDYFYNEYVKKVYGPSD